MLDKCLNVKHVNVLWSFLVHVSLLKITWQAQHLIFKYTEKGDLTGFISAYFDPKSAQALGLVATIQK